MRKPVLLVLAALLSATPLYAQRSTGDTVMTGTTCPGAGCVSLNVNDMGAASIQVSDTWSGTIVFEASTNGSGYVSAKATNIATGDTATSTTANGIWQINVGALTSVRARFTSNVSGVANVNIKTSANGSGTGSGGGGSGGTVTQGPASASDQWLVNCVTGCTGTTLGQTTMASSLPVAIASNQSAVPVTGTITAVTAITNALPAGANVIGHTIADTGSTTAVTGNVTAVQGTGTNLHTVVDSGTVTTVTTVGAVTAITNALPAGSNAIGKLAANSGVNVGTVDVATSALPTGASTSANQTTEITALQIIDDLPNALGSTTSGQKGAVALGAVTTAAPSYTTAQSNALSLDTAGGLRVNCVTGCTGSGGTSATDGATYTASTTAGTPMMAARDDSSPGALAEDKVGIVRQSTRRELYTTIRDAAGNERGANVNASGRLEVSVDGSTTVTEAATITANQSSVALTDSVLYAYDGSTDSRLRSRAGLIGSSDVGLVTRPFTASDGTNTAPTMDAVARPGFQKITDGTNTAIIDPCESSGATISTVAISQTASAVIKAGTSAKKTYVCAMKLIAPDAEIISVVGGTGAACGTNTVPLDGATTAANGGSLAANGGWVLPVAKISYYNTTINADDLCILQSGSGRIAGFIKVAVQ